MKTEVPPKFNKVTLDGKDAYTIRLVNGNHIEVDPNSPRTRHLIEILKDRIHP